MHRSSESIANLAAALAKAQAELVNPEKSLTATLRLETGARGKGSEIAERSFRYAPLSSGLDIVRKTLGQHEIATVQTTAIDQTAGLVNLTTVLAHASGEWIASDWPVCAVADTATPHRMGAALTYARRYALFTLVGIAGEDDVDAPDLASSPTSEPDPSRAYGNNRLNGGGGDRMSRSGRRLSPQGRVPTIPIEKRPAGRSAEPELEPSASAALRDKLVTELKGLASSDDAALWAHRSLPDKNRLNDTDAQQVEQSFQARLAILVAGAAAKSRTPKKTAQLRARSSSTSKKSRPSRIDKGSLALPEPRRIRDREHVKHVAQQPCLVCGRQPADAHHLRFTQSRALGRKVSDEYTVPLCRGHHREVHRCGDEALWWQEAGIDPTVAARALWLDMHPLKTGVDL